MLKWLNLLLFVGAARPQPPAIVIGSRPIDVSIPDFPIRPFPTPCPPNESRSTCCEGTCATGPVRVCTLFCIRPIRCTCIRGYVRNSAGKCIPYSDCPQTCPTNEVWVPCPTTCERTCPNRFTLTEISAIRTCVIARPCPPGRCQCAPGFVRNTDTDDCVRPGLCPRRPPFPCNGGPFRRPCPDWQRASNTTQKAPQDRNAVPALPMHSKPPKAAEYTVASPPAKSKPTEKTPQDQYAFAAPPAKPKSARKAPKIQNQEIVRDILEGIGQFFCPANSHWQACFPCDGTCARPVPICPLRPCIRGQGGCKCNDGFVRNSSNQCVRIASCSSQTCPVNESRGTCCEGTCATGPVQVCTLFCSRPIRCTCIRGYVRNSAGRCVPYSACQQTCPANEIFRTCASACEPTCATQNPQPCTLQCLSPRCQCAPGFVRQNGQCIRPQFCPASPQTCPANQQWNTCSTVCEPSCQNFNPTCQSFACGPPKCQCRPGFYRQSGFPNAPCIPWWQCPRWGGPRNGPRSPPRGGGGGGRGRPWSWWGQDND